jgi:membrane protein implicated in regulation of membrane protease activity
MVVLGLLLLAIGVLAMLAAVFSTSGTALFLGADLGSATLFFLGVAATLAVLCGLVLTRAGTGRALRHRRDQRRLRTLERERRRAGQRDGDNEPADQADGTGGSPRDPTV